MRGSKYGNVYWVSIDFSCDKRHLGAVFSYPWCQTLSHSFLSFLTYKSQLFRPSPLALRRAHSGLALARTVSQRRQLSVARFEPAPTGWNFWLGWAASRLPSYRSASPPPPFRFLLTSASWQTAWRRCRPRAERCIATSDGCTIFNTDSSFWRK